MLRQKIIEVGECWSDMRFWLELAQRMGYEEHFPWKDDEEVLDYLLEPSGLTLKGLHEDEPGGVFYRSMKYRQYEQRGFRTPSGKVELYSETLEKLGQDPLPTHRESQESTVSTPDLAREYPLILTTGARIDRYLHSQLHNIPRLRRGVPKPTAEIHPRTAAEYGIADGETINVETKRGSIEIEASLSDDILPRVVSIPHGWEKANVNLLTDMGFADPLTGVPAFKSMLCKINKIAA
jgi:anaerobic selenocysteine-containing dehydrogenase